MVEPIVREHALGPTDSLPSPEAPPKVLQRALTASGREVRPGWQLTSCRNGRPAPFLNSWGSRSALVPPLVAVARRRYFPRLSRALRVPIIGGACRNSRADP